MEKLSRYIRGVMQGAFIQLYRYFDGLQRRFN